MKRCPRCGQSFVIHHPTDRYCPPCHRDVTERDARPPKPAFVPLWMRRSLAKDLTPGRAA